MPTSQSVHARRHAPAAVAAGAASAGASAAAAAASSDDTVPEPCLSVKCGRRRRRDERPVGTLALAEIRPLYILPPVRRLSHLPHTTPPDFFSPTSHWPVPDEAFKFLIATTFSQTRLLRTFFHQLLGGTPPNPLGRLRRVLGRQSPSAKQNKRFLLLFLEKEDNY
jgi:hypothetical protein